MLPWCQRWRERTDRWVPSRSVIDPARFGVEPIDSDAVARAFVVQHHYAASYPAARARVGLYRVAPFRGPELVGVAVFAEPAQVATVPCWAGVPPAEGVVLGRFVLLDEVAGNGETWFLRRAFAALREIKPEVRAVVSYSDPLPRRTAGGAEIMPGHVGTIYQAHNGVYRGRSSRETLHFAPSGEVLARRTLSKLRTGERGGDWHAYSYEQLRAHGAPARRPGESGREYVVRALREGPFRRVRHPGNHVYVWGLDRDARRALPASAAYPKVREAA